MSTDERLNPIPGSAVLLKPDLTNKQLKFASGSDMSPSQVFTVEQGDTSSGIIGSRGFEFTVKQLNAMPNSDMLLDP